MPDVSRAAASLGQEISFEVRSVEAAPISVKNEIDREEVSDATHSFGERFALEDEREDAADEVDGVFVGLHLAGCPGTTGIGIGAGQ